MEKEEKGFSHQGRAQLVLLSSEKATQPGCSSLLQAGRKGAMRPTGRCRVFGADRPASAEAEILLLFLTAL